MYYCSGEGSDVCEGYEEKVMALFRRCSPQICLSRVLPIFLFMSDSF